MFQRLNNNRGSIPIISAVILSGAIYIGGKISLDKSVDQMKSEADRRAYQDLSMILSSGTNKIDQMVQAGFFKKAGEDEKCDTSSELEISYQATQVPTKTSDTDKIAEDLGFSPGGTFELSHCKIAEVSKNKWNSWLDGSSPNCSKTTTTIYKLKNMVCTEKSGTNPTRNFLVFEADANAKDHLSTNTKSAHIKKNITARINFKPLVPNGCQEAREQGEIKVGKFEVNFPSTRGKVECSGMKDNKDYSAVINGIHSNKAVYPEFKGRRAFCGFLGIRTKNNQKFYFDDGFAVTMNGIVLASGRLGSKKFGSKKDDKGKVIYEGMKEFDYGKIKGKKYDDTGEPGCAIKTKDCDVPATETNGPISIKPTKASNDIFAKEINKEVENIEKKNMGKDADISKIMKIEVHVTGDDDKDIDCQHDGLTLVVDYEYMKR